MRLAEWRKQEGYSQQQLADALDTTQATISMIERASYPRVPQPDLVRRIYVLTRGAVAPNDLYDLPPINQLQLPNLAPAEVPLFDGIGGISGEPAPDGDRRESTPA